MQIAFNRRWLLALLGSFGTTAFLRKRSEHGLVRAAQRGDREAFDELIRLHSPKLRGFAAKRLPVREIEDVLQETWIGAWAGMRMFEGEDRFRTWLFSICYKKVQDYWRREHARPTAEWPAESSPALAYLPKDFARAEVRQSLLRFWNTCSADQKELLNLYYGDGLTLKEIAEVVGRNLNTVKYQFYRVHEQASKELPELGTVPAAEVTT